VSPLRFRLLNGDTEHVRHLACGNTLRYDGYLYVFSCPCGQRWGADRMASFTETELTDRFSVTELPEPGTFKLVWLKDGKRKYLATVPSWTREGEPSGLS
jgi:hypothetical protein